MFLKFNYKWELYDGKCNLNVKIEKMSIHN